MHEIVVCSRWQMAASGKAPCDACQVGQDLVDMLCLHEERGAAGHAECRLCHLRMLRMLARACGGELRPLAAGLVLLRLRLAWCCCGCGWPGAAAYPALQEQSKRVTCAMHLDRIKVLKAGGAHSLGLTWPWGCSGYVWGMQGAGTC